MITKFPNSRGFAILYAILMVSIVLTISLTLLDISYKQLVLSSINRESKLAYYAAVNALNCATYWESVAANNTTGVPYQAFGYFTYSPVLFNSANKPIKCAGVTPTVSLSNQIFTFSLSFPQAGGGSSFAEVQVIQGNGVGVNGFAAGKTLIKVDGYNTSDLNHPRRVQRSLDSN